MARNYAAIPYEYLEEMEELSDAEFGRLTRALLKYSMTGEPIALCGNERFYIKRVMTQEDRFKASYDDLSEARSSAGKAGAEARWGDNGKNGKAKVANGKNGNTETETNTETDNYILPSNDGKNDKKTTRTRFIPPTVEEVAVFVKEKGLSVDPQRFVDFYESKGWMVGKNKMKDWKAACRRAEDWCKPTKPETFRADSDLDPELERESVERMRKYRESLRNL